MVTSYNALTQIRDVSNVLENDGLHIFPDVEYLKQNVGSEYVEYQGERRLKTESKGKTYYDFDRYLPSDELIEGYRSISCFRKRPVTSLTMTGKGFKSNSFLPPIEDTDVQMPGLSTPKLDGVCMKLIIDDNLDALIMRNGVGLKLQKSHTNFNCQLLVEKYPVEGPPTHFMAIRILLFNTWIPFHGLDTLERFCQRVPIEINGIRILPPSDQCFATLKSDGRIYRVEGKDYRLKQTPSIDLYDLEEFLGHAEDLGLSIMVDREHVTKGPLREFEVYRTRKGRYRLIYKRTRLDKDKETDYEGRLRVLLATAVLMPETAIAD